MDYLFVLLASLSAGIVIFSIFRRKSQEYQQAIHRLERKNTQLNLHLSKLATEEERLGGSIEALEGQVKLAILEASFAAPEPDESPSNMRFIDFLVHRGGITSDQLKKVERYKMQNASSMGYEELLILLDIISKDKLQLMKEAFAKVSTEQ